MADPLNPALYAGLVAACRAARLPKPQIVDRGEAFTYEVAHGNKQTTIRALSGEKYRLNCPFCGDSRERLYVHHKFGMASPDPRVKEKMTNLCYCQNEQKVVGYKLTKFISEYAEAVRLGLVHVASDGAEASAEQADPFRQEAPDWGTVEPLSAFKGTALTAYWEGRGYAPDFLAEHHGACVCVEHGETWMRDRLADRVIFPFTHQGTVLSWQARLCRPARDDKERKWWYPRGTKKIPWNMDHAEKYRCCILNEGVSSALAMGDAALGIGGKTISAHVLDYLKTNYDAVIVMLDPDAGINRKPIPGAFHPDGTPRLQKDYQKLLVERLNGAGIRAFSFGWWHGNLRDPDECGRDVMFSAMRNQFPWFTERVGYMG